MNVKFDWDKSRRQGILVSDHLDQIREHFSVKNEAARFMKFKNRFIPTRKYSITPAGRFDAGLTADIIKYINSNLSKSTQIIFTQQFTDNTNTTTTCLPVDSDISLPKLSIELRDYQTDIVEECIRSGRGVVILATAGGKTLTFATLLQYMFDSNNKFKCILIVPDRGLVEQTFNDFIEYGVKFAVSRWTGDDDLDLSSNVIISNLGILQSSNSDISWLKGIDACIIDETHKVRAGNKINSIFKVLHTRNIFGFTGTMPEDPIDQWNIVGKIGPVIYEKHSDELRQEKYISNVKVQVLKINYTERPAYPKVLESPADRYRAELQFIIHNKFRNNILSSLCNKMKNNALILVDYIEHGSLLHAALSSSCKDKKVFFIRGEVDIEDREKVKQIMEMNDNVIVVAISKIFSTGINIKNIHYIIFASGGKAKIKTVQSIGRGLRLHKNKSELIIFDIGDDLIYGNQHLAKRITFYQKENIEYGITPITQA